MSVLSRLCIRNLKANRKRTISTIIGIMLSVALICAVAAMGGSFQASLVENAVNEYGYWHVKLSDVSDEQIKELENNRDVKELFRVNQCGYALLSGSQNEDKPYVKLFSMEKGSFEDLEFRLIEGRFAENNKELVISDHIRYNGGVELKIGDKITLNVGERTEVADYEPEKDAAYSLLEAEEITDTSEYTFTIVGIIERPHYGFEEYSEAGYTAISTGIEQGTGNLYASLKNPKEYKQSLAEMLGVASYEDIGEDTQTEFDFTLNKELLRWEVFAFSDSTVAMLYSVIGVVVFIILFTSVFCIRNSFAIATTEKIKMYSMLASVGTTKKQIRQNVLMEGLILGLIGIPFGILSGYVAVFVLLKIVNLLIGDQLLTYIDGLVFQLSWQPVLLSAAMGFLTILLSVRSSAKKAARVSPIDGLRNTNEIKITGRKLKVPGIIGKVFKTGGVLAYKNLKRSRKKYRTTVISIAVSIFVFVTMNAFIVNMFDLTGDYYEDYNYNLEVQCDLEELEGVLAQDNIDSYTVLYSAVDYYKISDLSKINYKDETELDPEVDFNEETEEYVETGKRYSALQIMALDSKDFKSYVEGMKLDYEDVKDKGILCDENMDYDEETGKERISRRYTYKAGDVIEGSYMEEPLSIPVGATADVKPDGINRSMFLGGYLIVNRDVYENLEFYYCTVTIQSDNVNQLEQDLTETGSYGYVHNYEATARKERAMILVIKIFLYGFIAVISLIGVTNIFNTITSNMELRQKEFAMLKSVGMTKREFNRMVNLETIFYGTKAWIYGVIMGLLGTLALYKAFSVKKEDGLYIPVNAILISALFVFLFIFVIMRYSIKKINKQNTIETIRKETV